MSFFGSLYASTSGMMAASRATQTTSQNVANMTTVGYKNPTHLLPTLLPTASIPKPTDNPAVSPQQICCAPASKDRCNKPEQNWMQASQAKDSLP